MDIERTVTVATIIVDTPEVTDETGRMTDNVPVLAGVIGQIVIVVLSSIKAVISIKCTCGKVSFQVIVALPSGVQKARLVAISVEAIDTPFGSAHMCVATGVI